jgi:SagB-type dehydrogenase family enzyme
VLASDAAGKISARFDQHSVDLGEFDAVTAGLVQDLRAGVALEALESGSAANAEGLNLLASRLAVRGLLEYGFGRGPDGEDLIVIEPQMPGYWPRMRPLDDASVFTLSRFAYLRRRGTDMVLESPRAPALFKICDPKIAGFIAMLAMPQPLRMLRSRDGFPGVEILALLVDCGIVYLLDSARDECLRRAEGHDDLVLWDFHDLLFHARSTQGRHANPSGGLYRHVGAIPPLPALRPRWPGKKIELLKLAALDPIAPSPVAKVLRDRHSTRIFDEQQPITLAELARFLDATARVQSTWKSRADIDGDGPVVEYAARPYPSGGGCWELELYLSIDRCEGLARGFYHYDAGLHVLVPIAVRQHELDGLLEGAEYAMGAPAVPQVLITIAARFGRISWKYSAIAYALILKDTGALIQTFYIMATEMRLGGCAIGTANIDQFARMTGIEFYVEGPVGQFALGRSAKPIQRE